MSVYIDFQPNSSGAIRCIGPFGDLSSSRSKVEAAMLQLTLELEQNYLDKGEFVVWGAYSDHPEFSEHRVKILDTICGFIPAPWMRAQLFGSEYPKYAEREWDVQQDVLTHRSGLTFPNVSSSKIDNSMFHPITAELAVLKLLEFSNKLRSLPHRSLELPLFKWTPLAISARRS